MGENNVAIEQTVVEQTESVKTEPAKETKPDPEVQKLKAALSRANGEAADYKRQADSYKEQLRAKQTEQERAEAERAEADKAMREELETLRKEKRVSDYTAKCVALNMDAELAAQTANALADGNMDSVFECLEAFVEATKTRLSNEALNRQPGLSAGIPPTKGTVNDEEYEKMRRYAGLSPHR